LTKVAKYILYSTERINRNVELHSNDLEDFLDEMAEKYYKNADATSERLFGKTDFATNDYMYKTVTK
jgi:hypothetical protein